MFLPLLASGISTALQYTGEKKQLERDEARNRRLQAKSAQEAEARKRSIEGSFGVDPFTMEALEMARSKQGIKELQDQQNITSANQAELAARLGARGGFNALALERQRQKGIVDAAAAQRQGEQSALESVGDIKRSQDAARRKFDTSMFSLAESDRRTAMEEKLAAQDSQKALKTNLITDGISALSPLLGLVGSGKTNGRSNFMTQLFGKHGMKTPGKFSHESNPINLMQGGAKVGEVTGGEYVVNPEQARKIAQQSEYASKLFRKFDKES